MLPVLFSVVLSPFWAPLAAAALSLLSGAWQVRGSRVAGDPWKKALQAGALWAGGTAVVLFLAVRMLGDPGNNDLLHLKRPLAIPLHTYGLLIATAFLVAMQLAGRAARLAGLDRERVMDLCFWILLAAMVGSRILFIMVNWQDYAHDPASIFAFWKGGLVFYGGFIGAVLVSIWYMRKNRMPFIPYADAIIPAVAIGHALWLMLYAPLRALVETMRGDEERGRVFNFVGPWARGAWWNLSTSELISVGIFALGVALYLVLGRRAGVSAQPAAA